jgi:hypothetical protein
MRVTKVVGCRPGRGAGGACAPRSAEGRAGRGAGGVAPSCHEGSGYNPRKFLTFCMQNSAFGCN